LELGSIKNALKMVHKCESLEELALTVLGLLRIDRLDLAEKRLDKMAEIDDDDAISQIARLWCTLSKPLAKKDDILVAIAELIEKNGSSPMLLEFQACVQLQDGNYTEALKILKEARNLAISLNQPRNVTLFNSLTATNFLESSGGLQISQHITQELQQLYPDHHYFEDARNFDDLFSRAASRWAA